MLLFCNNPFVFLWFLEQWKIFVVENWLTFSLDTIMRHCWLRDMYLSDCWTIRLIINLILTSLLSCPSNRLILIEPDNFMKILLIPGNFIHLHPLKTSDFNVTKKYGFRIKMFLKVVYGQDAKLCEGSIESVSVMGSM